VKRSDAVVFITVVLTVALLGFSEERRYHLFKEIIDEVFKSLAGVFARSIVS